jgi:hypothetical protein
MQRLEYEGLKAFAEKPQHIERLEAIWKHGTFEKAAKALGVTHNAISQTIQIIRKKAAEKGYAPDEKAAGLDAHGGAGNWKDLATEYYPVRHPCGGLDRSDSSLVMPLNSPYVMVILPPCMGGLQTSQPEVNWPWQFVQIMSLMIPSPSPVRHSTCRICSRSRQGRQR